MLRAIPRRRVLAASAVAAAALGGRSGAADTSRAAADPCYRITAG